MLKTIKITLLKFLNTRHRDTALLAVGFGALAVSGVLSFFLKDGSWFARSGSIATLLGAFVQFRLSTAILAAHSDAAVINGILGVGSTPNISKLTKTLSTYSVILICVAAIIWGYGDLLFPTPP